MSAKKFLQHTTNTLSEILQAASQTLKRERLHIAEFLGKCLRDSFPGAYYVFLKSEIEALTKSDSVTQVQNETSNKVAILIGGYYLSPATLLPIKQSLEKEGIKVILLNQRQYSKNSITQLTLSLKENIKQNKGKDIVLFGYSSGGIIAHRIGEVSGLKSVSFGVPQDLSSTMVAALLGLTTGKTFTEFNVPKTGKNIIETFSAMVPNSGENMSSNTTRLQDTYSHMAIGKVDVVEAVKKEIIDSFLQ